MNTYFPNIKEIEYEGPLSKNALAFKYFAPDREVAGKKMGEHLKFAVAYWHTFRGTGSDPFGGAVYERPWGKESHPMEAAQSTMEAMFEFLNKLGAKYYCFHDRDIAPEGASLSESQTNFKTMVDLAEKWQKETGKKLLWATANLFSHPRYTHGAASNPDPRVIAVAAAQVRSALEATVRLGGTGYVFWGGREGYANLLNTNMKQEREQMARFFHMAVDYAKEIGFKGKFFIEPKPKEPMTHQYDFDAATTLNFLREFDLLEHFQLNLESNHATLAGHTYAHELEVASSAGALGSLDINRGDLLLGWDTDQFPTDLQSATLTMVTLLKQGGLQFGGLNFDAKVRRGSFDVEDLFHAHIGGMDTYARGLLVADRLIRDGVLEEIVSQRYQNFQSEMGQKILKGEATLVELENWALNEGEPPKLSGREEAIENLLNDYLYAKGIE